MITEFLSYVPLLVKTLEKEKPKRIFEWGVGTSTAIMATMLPKSKIYSVEHNLRWYWFWKFKFRNVKNVKIIYSKNMDEYITTPFFLEDAPFFSNFFDFIFVDGRERVECLKVAKPQLSKKGSIMLHDTFRNRYKKGTDLFKIIKEERNTMLLK